MCLVIILRYIRKHRFENGPYNADEKYKTDVKVNNNKKKYKTAIKILYTSRINIKLKIKIKQQIRRNIGYLNKYRKNGV